MSENTEHTDDLPGGFWAYLRREVSRQLGGRDESNTEPGGYFDTIRDELARRGGRRRFALHPHPRAADGAPHRTRRARAAA
ncbi:MAG: hypothetical protein M5R40_07240 [Anaerolineae bacterium]|nr:hypothetical protein [Anaerolineae bacterium]